MAAVAFAYALVLVALVIVVANVPAGFQNHYGLHLESRELFRSFWTYPERPLTPEQFAFRMPLLLTLLHALYFVAIAVAGAGSRQASPTVILISAVLFNAILAVFLPSVLSADVFHYALYGRFFALQGVNPYNVPADAGVTDPFWALASWRDATTLYGPAWPLLSAGAAWAGRHSVVGTVVAFKLLAAFFHLAGAMALLSLLRQFAPTRATRALLVYAWNPLILIESAGAGHNDIAMVALALVSIWCLTCGYWTSAGAVAAASILIKYITGLLFGLVLLGLWRHLSVTVRRIAVSRFVAGAIGASCVIYAPFLSGLDQPQQLLRGLSPAVHPVPNRLGPVLRDWLGVQGASWWSGDAAVNAAMHSAFAVALVVLAARVWRSAVPVATAFECFALASLLYTAVVFGSGLPWYPWYLIWPLTAATLFQSRRGWILPASLIAVSMVFLLAYGARH